MVFLFPVDLFQKNMELEINTQCYNIQAAVKFEMQIFKSKNTKYY